MINLKKNDDFYNLHIKILIILIILISYLAIVSWLFKCIFFKFVALKTFLISFTLETSLRLVFKLSSKVSSDMIFIFDMFKQKIRKLTLEIITLFPDKVKK